MSKYIDSIEQACAPFDPDVGYCRPPQEHQFKPGQCGNPHGRPKGSKNKSSNRNSGWFGEIVLQEAHRTVSIEGPEGSTEMSAAQAVVRSLAVKAREGNPRSQKLFMEALDSIDRESKRAWHNLMQAAIDYQVAWERELTRRRRVKSLLPDPVPHPDHIEIDMQSGSFRITGPMTEAERTARERIETRKQEGLDTLQMLDAILQQTPDHPAGSFVVAEIAREKRINECILTVIEGQKWYDFS